MTSAEKERRIKKEDKDEEKDKDKDKVKEEDDEEDDGEGQQKGSAGRRRKRKRKRSAKADAKKGETGADADDDVVPTKKLNNDDKEAALDRTIFIEGIPYSSNRKEIEAVFAEHSITDITDVRLPMWQDSGRLRGYGHVEFASEKSVEEALKLTKKCYIQSRYLSIQKANAPGAGSKTSSNKSSTPSSTLLVKGLDYKATEEDITKVMEQFGKIITGGVRIVRNYKTHVSKGFAYVEYESLESAKKAMEGASSLRILDRQCQLDYDNVGGRMKGSFKTSSGKLWTNEFKKPKKVGGK